MLIRIRSLLLISDYRYDEETNTADYLDVQGDVIMLTMQPAILSGRVAVQVETDRNGAKGRLVMKGPGVKGTIPFDIPAGWRVASFTGLVQGVVDEPGELLISAVDEDGRTVAEYQFDVTFATDAVKLSPADRKRMREQFAGVGKVRN